ncbi:hypothetical protein JOF56_007923 [Kibdelosporangium banguiense]|uniref:Uncharacterized protein n=1 Tax=Kibdelosporangium banguiense TaxID=1365924 RepID=A0ABS4TT13_9PSEU|nr:hypothetical protein [Kibdelosporangium banguiense]MBP2327538.1 hypothetical protein [Kibdelosporangium banguiense]
MATLNDPNMDLQEFAQELAYAVEGPDRAALATLSPEARQAQLAARHALHKYLTDVWQAAKRRDEDPANNPEYTGIAALRDLMMYLVEFTSQAE